MSGWPHEPAATNLAPSLEETTADQLLVGALVRAHVSPESDDV
jgi:hypothetical protein